MAVNDLTWRVGELNYGLTMLLGRRKELAALDGEAARWHQILDEDSIGTSQRRVHELEVSSCSGHNTIIIRCHVCYLHVSSNLDGRLTSREDEGSLLRCKSSHLRAFYGDVALIIHIHKSSSYSFYLLLIHTNLIIWVIKSWIADPSMRSNERESICTQFGKVSYCCDIIQMDLSKCQTDHADSRNCIIDLWIPNKDCSVFVLYRKNQSWGVDTNYSSEWAGFDENILTICCSY